MHDEVIVVVDDHHLRRLRDGLFERLAALAAVRDQMQRAADAGHGDQDMAATIHASRPD